MPPSPGHPRTHRAGDRPATSVPRWPATAGVRGARVGRLPADPYRPLGALRTPVPVPMRQARPVRPFRSTPHLRHRSPAARAA